VNPATAIKPSPQSANAPEIRRHTVTVDGIALRCIEAGSGAPLLYLHGAGGLRLSQTHRALARERRLIALELPGFGNTPAGSAHQSARALAATMAKAIDVLGIGPCALMGHSLGANVALWLAIDNAPLVSTLVLVSPTAIRPQPSGIGGALPREIPPFNPDNLWIDDESDAGVRTAARERAQKLSGPPRDAEFEQALESIAAPVLCLFGTRGAIVSTDAAREYTRRLPKCFTTLVYDAGHDIDLDRPDAVTSVVRNFLQNGETFIVNRDNAIINP